MQSRAKNTVKSYNAGFEKWKKWTKQFNKEVCPFPANDYFVALYLVSLIQSNRSHNTITQVFYGIKFVHDMLKVKNPCKSTLVKSIHEASKRLLAKPVRKKEIIKAVHLQKLTNYFKNKDSLPNLRTLTMCLTSFSGFLRFSELSNLRRSDIVFRGTYMKLFIEKSKTDVYRDGAWVPIAKTGSSTCPLSMMKRYIKKAQIPKDSDEFLFRGLSYFRKSRTYKLRKKNKPLSYSRARKIILDAFEEIGLKRQNFGLHSLRAGGASAAANAGVKDRLFKRHGRWKSDRAKDGYIKDSLQSLLSVSLRLGL